MEKKKNVQMSKKCKRKLSQFSRSTSASRKPPSLHGSSLLSTLAWLLLLRAVQCALILLLHCHLIGVM